MRIVRRMFLYVLLSLSFIMTGCATVSTPSYNYEALLAAKPRSIVVIPPRNNSIEVNAPYVFLSTISKPLGEKGYYVFPVAVIDTFMKENGLPTPEEMNLVPLDKIRQHIGADAVLYTDIVDWGQKYNLLSSDTVVSVSMRLVDTRTGTQLWDASASARQSSDSGDNNLLSQLVNAAATQIINSISDKTPQLAREVNWRAVNNRYKGLLNGPYARTDENQ